MANTTGLGDTIYAAVRKALEDKNGGGGGGGGDFTTATVTMQAAEGSTVALELECARVAPEGLPDATSTYAYSEASNYEFTAALYKGKCLAHPPFEGVTITTSGNVTYDEDLESYVITGDCAFTFDNR